jgi:translocation and assembly module TamA
VTLSATPSLSLASAGGNTVFVSLQAAAATFLDIGARTGGAPGRSVLALRGLVGTIPGAPSPFDIPPDQRFYAGGGGTIRGYRFQSVGPQFPDGRPTGGNAVDVGTVEWRQRLFGDWGAAVFVDAGQVGTGTAPFTGDLRVGAGAGVRYFTPIGPVRLDLAVPLVHQPKSDTLEVYIGLGQAF